MDRNQVLGGLLAVVVLSGSAFSFLFGGRESRRRTFDPPASGWNNGFTYGSRYFYAKAGSRVDITYRVKIARGAFYVYVKRFKAGLDGTVAGSWEVPSDGSGQWSAIIPETGTYYILADGQSTRGSRGYDVDYTVSWRIHQNLLR